VVNPFRSGCGFRRNKLTLLPPISHSTIAGYNGYSNTSNPKAHTGTEVSVAVILKAAFLVPPSSGKQIVAYPSPHITLGGDLGLLPAVL